MHLGRISEMRSLSKITIMMLAFLLTGCMGEQASYKVITQSTAHDIIHNEEIFLMDVRTPAEFEEIRIPGAILVPVDTLKAEFPSRGLPKNTKILVYCRSGNRSKVASEYLVELGYVNVHEFGGINTWQYETEGSSVETP